MQLNIATPTSRRFDLVCVDSSFSSDRRRWRFFVEFSGADAEKWTYDQDEREGAMRTRRWFVPGYYRPTPALDGALTLQ
jgi:hypothetical protein